MPEYQTREKITRVKNAVAAGTSAITDATVVDMAGFESCEFLVLFGTIVSGSDVDVTVYGSDDAAGSPDDFTALTGATAAVADTADNDVLRIEVSDPAKRYLQVRLTRATQNATIDGILAIQRGAGTTPVTDGATVIATSTSVARPAEV